MTRKQLSEISERPIADALKLVPKDIRADAKPAAQHAFIRGVEHALSEVIADDSACDACKKWQSRIVSRLQIHND